MNPHYPKNMILIFSKLKNEREVIKYNLGVHEWKYPKYLVLFHLQMLHLHTTKNSNNIKIIIIQNQISKNYASALHACCINNNKIQTWLFVHAWNAEEAVPKTKPGGKQLRLRSEKSRRWSSEEGSKALIWVTMVVVLMEKMKSNKNTLKSNDAILIMVMHNVNEIECNVLWFPFIGGWGRKFPWIKINKLS